MIDMGQVMLSSKYQVVIPKDAREQLGLSAGDRLEVFVLDGRIELVPARLPRRLKGFLCGIDTTIDRESDR